MQPSDKKSIAISSAQTIWSMRFTASFSSTKLSDPATEPMFGNSSFAHARLPPFLLVEMEQYRVLNIFPGLDLQNEQFQNKKLIVEVTLDRN